MPEKKPEPAPSPPAGKKKIPISDWRKKPKIMNRIVDEALAEHGPVPIAEMLEEKEIKLRQIRGEQEVLADDMFVYFFGANTNEEKK